MTKKLSKMLDQALENLARKLFPENDFEVAKDRLKHLSAASIKRNIVFNALQKAGINDDVAGEDYSNKSFVNKLKSSIRSVNDSLENGPIGKTIDSVIDNAIPQENPVKNRNNTVDISKLTKMFIDTLNNSVFDKKELKSPYVSSGLIVENFLERSFSESVTRHIKHHALLKAGIEDDSYQERYSDETLYKNIEREIQKVAKDMEKETKPDSLKIFETLEKATSEAISFKPGRGLPDK